MNRKQYVLSLVIVILVPVALITINAFHYFLDWIWIFLISTIGYMFIKYRLSGPIQMFANKFNMLVDYDLDISGAEHLAQEGVNNAATKNIKAMYMMYLGMAKYYSGKYEDAIKTLNSIELNRLNTVYHILIFSFTGYAAVEIDDIQTVDFSIERIKNVSLRVAKKYQGFAASYLEILEAIKNVDVSLDQYKDVIDKHFTRNDGYISTKLVYNYRMAIYYKKLNDILEMDKCLAFIIANGKEHHMAIKAKQMFQGSVNIEDYLIVEGDNVVSEQQPEVIEEDPLMIDTEESQEEDKEE
ncbi:MAG: hypothetical protein KJ971_01550 [Firmicutes bacterium]|nr:hypothetical protein [Bacillota bacterium]